MPPSIVRPSCASPTAVSNSCSIFSAGRDLDADERLVVTDVREVVLLAGGNDNNLAGPGDDPLASHLEAHRAFDDLEPLLLERVDVLAPGDPAVRGELEVDRQQRAGRLRRGLAERDPLAAGGVLECLS